MLQVLLVLVCLELQQQRVELHSTMVLLVLLLHRAALESQPQQTQQQQQLQLHQPRLAQLAVQLAVQVHHLQAAVLHHLVLVLLAAVAVAVVLLLVHQDPQVEDTMVAVTNYHSKNQVTHYLLHQKEESHFILSVLCVDF